MRSITKKIACVLTLGAMVTALVPTRAAQAADDPVLLGTAPMVTSVLGSNSAFALNRTNQILYVNEGADYNKQTYDFNFAKAPENYLKDYSFAWATDKAEVATVKAGGVVTAVGVGKAKISCAVTLKGTTDVVATVSADVEVKANAAKVEISNAADYEGKAFAAGDVIDLNRTMTDAIGAKTNKRGLFVTDMTRWIAKPATGVEINQSNGQFTFTEEAEGEYELFCETYQSAAHPETTASSAPVKVTVNKAAAVSVVQKNASTFTVFFNKPVQKLSVPDVTVNRVYTNEKDTYRYPQYVKSVTLAKDNKSAEIELFSMLSDAKTYEVVPTGLEAVAFTASVGKPASMTLSVKKDEVLPFVLAGGEAQEIFVHLYDKNGVEVTDLYPNSTVMMETKTYSEDGSYYVAGNMIYCAKAGLSVDVKAEYMSGEFDEAGNPVGDVTAEFTFVSVDEPTVFVAGVSRSAVWTSGMKDISDEELLANGNLSMTTIQNAELVLEIADSTGKKQIIKENGEILENGLGSITFEDVTPNVAALNKDNGYLGIVAYNEGVATFIVNLVDDKGTVIPIGSVSVTIMPAGVLTSVKLSTDTLILPAVETYPEFDFGKVEVEALDQYGNSLLPKSGMFSAPRRKYITVEAVNSIQSDAVRGCNVGIDCVEFCGCDIMNAIAAEPASVQVPFKIIVTIDGVSKEARVNVTLKKPIENADIVSLSLQGAKEGANVAIYKENYNNPDDFYLTAKLVVKNNGVAVGYEDLNLYPDNAEKAVVGKYYAKVLKNGKEIPTDTEDEYGKVIECKGGDVKVRLFNVTEVQVKANASPDVYTHDITGEGTYTIVVYQAVNANGKKVLVQKFSQNRSFTYDRPERFILKGRNDVEMANNTTDELWDTVNICDIYGTPFDDEYVTNNYMFYVYNYEPDATDYYYLNYVYIGGRMGPAPYTYDLYKVMVNMVFQKGPDYDNNKE